MTLRQQLKSDLKVDRYNLAHLAEEASVTPAYLYTILSGKLLPSVHVATSLAMAASRMTNKTYTPDMFLTIATKELNNG